MLSGRRRRFTDIEGAEAFLAEWAGTPLLADVEGRAIAGDTASVRARLADKAAAAGVDEVFVMSTGPTLAKRIASLELLKPE
jgi:alkanesulfonate monooxygenase SsuD/methylene tetrahydromethanopterin reductase-like flavin-dependent oxidoreductase (luciferase family)